jgi:hypothetical protein
MEAVALFRNCSGSDRKSHRRSSNKAHSYHWSNLIFDNNRALVSVSLHKRSASDCPIDFYLDIEEPQSTKPLDYGVRVEL